MSREKLQNIIEDFDLHRFKRFFSEKNRSFRESSESIDTYSDQMFRNGQKLGDIQFDDASLMVCAIEVTRELTERTGKKAQYEIGKKILKATQMDSGIFIFYNGTGAFRFSLIYANYLGKKRDWSSFKRCTYYVSEDLTNKTFLQRIGDGDFSSLAKIKEAFSVEKVTKEFYENIANWYFWAVQHCRFPKDAEAEENGRNIAVIRLITRMIFIWFMRERGLVPKSLFDKSRVSSILKDLSDDKSDYYRAILQNLFFATLSTKQANRKFRSEVRGHKGINPDFGNHNVYRYHELFKVPKKIKDYFGEIPFLNGGLFECLDDKPKGIYIDGFTSVKKNQPEVPNQLFFSSEKKADLNAVYGTKGKSYKVKGLLDILSSFNFTIDENSPDDQDIALDPELLGRVFENLLASYNPETASTARKATGSYYTPREIVDYMVTESLKAYFKTHLNDIEDIDKKLDQLFLTGSDENPFNKKESAKIVDLIESVRIVDPAVGSGAFPMGALNKLVFILNKLDPGNELWKQAQLSAADSIPDPRIKKDTKARIEEFFEGKNADYGRKLYLIQKCIYGVDIQEIAVEIAKLRFFISLLVDEKIDSAIENMGIEPLPNLDFKIMQGNSLISEYMGIDFDNGTDTGDTNGQTSLIVEPENDRLIKEFEQKKIDFQNEPDKEKKDRLKEEIDDLMIRLFESMLKKQKSDYFKKIKAIEEKYSALPDKQKREEIIAKEKQALSKKEGFDLEKFEQELRELSGKNKTKPFFAWKLYFAEVFGKANPGFDIVIANPPWGISLSDLEKIKISTLSGVSKSFDSSEAFIFIGNNLLMTGGILSYIVPKSIIFANKWRYTRNLILNNQILCLGDCGISFEVVNLESVVVVFKKSAHTCEEANVSILRFEPTKRFSSNKVLIGLPAIKQALMVKSEVLLLSHIEMVTEGILRSVQKQSFLADYDRDVFRGIYIPDSMKAKIIGKGRHQFVNKVPDVSMYSINKIVNIDLSKDLGTYAAKVSKLSRDRIIVKVMRGSRLTCAYANADILTTEKLVNLVINEVDVSQYYVLAILNSKLCSFYLNKAVFSDITETSRVMDDCYLMKCPIPRMCQADQKPFIKAVEKILSLTTEPDYSDNPSQHTNVKQLQNEIDQLVYKLYDLTPEEIAVVEGNISG